MPSKVPKMKKNKQLFTLLCFIIGLLGGWFVVDYVILVLMQYNLFQPICINGVHVHHLYIGIAMTIAGGIAWRYAKKEWIYLVALVVGIGVGLILSDVISHLTWDAPFSLWC